MSSQFAFSTANQPIGLAESFVFYPGWGRSQGDPDSARPCGHMFYVNT